LQASFDQRPPRTQAINLHAKKVLLERGRVAFRYADLDYANRLNVNVAELLGDLQFTERGQTFGVSRAHFVCEPPFTVSHFGFSRL